EIGRPFFKKYVPVIREVASAGWQPVPHARAYPESLGLERFGDGTGDVYLTLRNFSNHPDADYRIAVDLEALGWTSAEAERLLEEDGEGITTRLESTTLWIQGSIA